MLVDVWITRRYYGSKDYSEFLGPKHKSVLAKQKVFWQNTFWQNRKCFGKTLSVLPSHFLFYLLGLFIHIGEKLFQGYIQKSSLVIGDYKKIWNRAKIFFVRPQYCPPPPPLQYSVFLLDANCHSYKYEGFRRNVYV